MQLESAILAVKAGAGQKFLEGATKVTIEHCIDDWVQCRVAVTEPEDDSKHWVRHFQSGQQ